MSVEIRSIPLNDLKTSVGLPYDLAGADGRVILSKGEVIHRYEIALLRSLGVECLYRVDSPAEAAAIQTAHNVACVQPNEVKPGEPLARSVFSKTGALLLRKGAELTHEYLMRLNRLEIEQVSVHQGNRKRPESQQFKMARDRLSTRMGNQQESMAELAPWETECFVRALINVCDNFANLVVKTEDNTLAQGIKLDNLCYWQIPVSGEVRRTLLLSMSQDGVRQLVGRIVNLRSGMITRDHVKVVMHRVLQYFVEDAQVMVEKAGSDAVLGHPIAIYGEAVNAEIPRSVDLLVVPFHSKIGDISLAITLEKRAKRRTETLSPPEPQAA